MKSIGQETRQAAAPIAIVGMGCIFPKARNLREYWRLIRTGADGISDVPPTHWNPRDYLDADPKRPDMTYCARGGFLSAVPFDPIEFGIPPTSLEATDTAQLLGLVVARMAMDDAGYGETGGREFNREKTSVILGVTGTLELALPLAARLGHPLWRRALADSGVPEDVAEQVVERIADGYVPWQENSFPGLLGNVVAGRIANRLNLRGTNCVVDAACASSLSAVHLAMLELATGRADMALTGGVDTLNDIFMFMCFSKTPALSPTGDARPFSEDGDGTVIGEGVGMVVLKRLADAQRDGDRIYAVIRGIGSSSDGRSQSIYAPHAVGQARCLRNAYRNADADPATIELIEAHGTGTKVGDAVEVDALKTIFRESRSDGAWCALGSVKSQIGHTKAAAGAAGLIKAALALHYGALPPTIKAERPNAKMNLPESPFYLSTELRPWLTAGDHPRRAGVSSFGFGGSNFHAVLEEYSAGIPQPAWDGAVQLVAFSGESVGRLLEQATAFRSAITAPAAPEGLRRDLFAFHAARTRREFSTTHQYRLVLVMPSEEKTSLDAVVESLKQSDASQGAEELHRRFAKHPYVYFGTGPAPGKLAVLFPGQGSQYVRMARDLACTFPEVRSALADAEAAFQGHGRLIDAVFPRPTPDASADEHRRAITRTDVAQPAIGAISLGMYRVLQRFGLHADMLAGHSYGELTALCAAGRLDPTAFWPLSVLRGRLMAECGDQGTMLAVSAPLAEIDTLIRDERLEVVLANRNTPSQGILSGRHEDVARAAEACKRRGWACKPLAVSGAFHSSLMAAARDPFRNALAAVTMHPSATPVFANSTGAPYPTESAAARELLGMQMVQPVRFVEQVEAMYAEGARTFVEAGPKSVLTGLVTAILGDRPHAALAVDASSGRHNGVLDLAAMLARLAALGHAVDLTEWEVTPPEPRSPKMVVPLVGANYRADLKTSSQNEAEPPTVRKTPISGRRPLPTPGTAHVPGVMQHRSVRDREGSPTLSSAPTPGRNAVAGVVQPAIETRKVTRPPCGENQPAPVAGTHVSSAPAGPRTNDVAPSAVNDSGNSALLPQAMQLVQEGLRAMQALQQQTAAAHQRFLEQQETAHRTFQQLMEGQQRLVQQALGQPVSVSAPSVAPAAVAPPPRIEARPSPVLPPVSVTGPPAATHVTARSVSIQPAPAPAAPRPPKQVAPARVESQDRATNVKLATPAAPARPPKSNVPVPSREIESVLLAVVGEKTGYPLEMLGLDMDIEADLGIDSIKRVEIVAGVEERLPQAGRIQPEYMGGLRTLRQIAEFMGGAAAETAAPSIAPVAEASMPAATVRGESRSSPATNGNGVASELLGIVSELTGYPREMLGLDMDIESDLGIDSIKRVEILAAAESRLAGFKPVNPEYMGGLRTLREILASGLGGVQSADAPAEETASPFESAPHAGSANQIKTTVEDQTAVASLVERRVLTRIDLAQARERAWPIARDRDVVITDDDSGLSAALVESLNRRGICARLAAVGSQIQGDVGGLIIVAPATPAVGTTWSVNAERFLKYAFLTAQSAAASLQRSASDGGALFATVARLDGAFGLRGSDFDAGHGGLAGLIKTAVIEWPGVRCRALDVAPEWTDDANAAEAVIRELSSEGPNEVGLDRTARRGLSLVERSSAATHAQLSINKSDVVIVTGGARGVTAEAALALASACRPTLVLIGRSPAPMPEPAWLAGMEEPAAIKQAILREEFQRAGRTAKPAELESAFRRWMANREIAANLRRIAEAGARVEYVAADVRDARAVARVVADIRQRLGPVRGLIHAAGVIEDRRIVDKSSAQFDAVFDTKVAGLRNLLEAIDPDELRQIVLFSSVSARFGNVGQVDYAMANEVLNKAVQRLAKQRPHCRVVSLNWGPWDGGMVGPALRREFERRGVGLIPLADGARAMVAEMANAAPDEVEVVLGSGLEAGGHPTSEPMPATRVETLSPVTHTTRPMSPTFRRELDVANHPFLSAHQLNGKPVLPVAMMIEWLAHAALHGHPGLTLCGIDDLRLLRGLVLESESRVITCGAGKARRDGTTFHVPVELRSDDGKTLHARGSIQLAPKRPEANAFVMPAELSGRSSTIDLADAYGEWLFHGPFLHAIKRIDTCNETGAVARLRAAAPPGAWMSDPPRSAFLTDPLILDGAFQLAIVWCQAQLGMPSLPSGFAAYRQFRECFPPTGVTTVLTVREANAHRLRCDFAFVDDAGELVARLDGYECTASVSLQAAFAQRPAMRA